MPRGLAAPENQGVRTRLTGPPQSSRRSRECWAAQAANENTCGVERKWYAAAHEDGQYSFAVVL